MLEVMRGKKPDRPPSGFSDALWDLLLVAWDAEHGSQPPGRPSIRTILTQLEGDASEWDEYIIPPVPEQGDDSCRSLTRLKMWGDHSNALQIS